MSNENLTEKTLADVKAGIPARDAEIETLRKENTELREQLEAIGAGGIKGKLMPGAVSAEPVAWMLTGAHGHTRCVWVEAPSAEMLEMAKIDGDTVTPLYSRPVSDQAQPENFDNDTKMVAGCCGRSECGGECGNDWVGMVPAQQPVSGADQFRDAAQMIEPCGNSGELPPLPKPDSYLFQHEETGLTECVDGQQVGWGFEKNNPRHQKIGGMFTETQMKEYASAALAQQDAARNPAA